MEVTCPGCGRHGRIASAHEGMTLSCPACKTRWTVGSQGAAASGTPSAADDEARRLRRGFVLCGLAILAGLLLPFVGVGPSPAGDSMQLRAAGVWDLWSFLDTKTQVAMGVLAGLGVLLIVLGVEKP